MLLNYSSKVSKICCFISTISRKFNCEGIKNNTPTLKEQGIHAMTLSWARSRVWFISLLVPPVFTIPQMVIHMWSYTSKEFVHAESLLQVRHHTATISVMQSSDRLYLKWGWNETHDYSKPNLYFHVH